jgi:hypothetical protein
VPSFPGAEIPAKPGHPLAGLPQHARGSCIASGPGVSFHQRTPRQPEAMMSSASEHHREAEQLLSDARRAGQLPPPPDPRRGPGARHPRAERPGRGEPARPGTGSDRQHREHRGSASGRARGQRRLRPAARRASRGEDLWPQILSRGTSLRLAEERRAEERRRAQERRVSAPAAPPPVPASPYGPEPSPSIPAHPLPRRPPEEQPREQEPGAEAQSPAAGDLDDQKPGGFRPS